MKILETVYNAIRDFEFTVSGGFAIYFLMCTLYVTIIGVLQLGSRVISWFK